MLSSSQTAFLRLPRRLAEVDRSWPIKLMVILRSSAKLRTAVGLRTRRLSSRKVTSSTQWGLFSIDQCRRIA